MQIVYRIWRVVKARIPGLGCGMCEQLIDNSGVTCADWYAARGQCRLRPALEPKPQNADFHLPVTVVGASAKGPCRYMVYTWGPKGFLYPICLRGPFGPFGKDCSGRWQPPRCLLPAALVLGRSCGARISGFGFSGSGFLA